MARTPMTPERFQSRDVKRRLTKLEKDLVYRDAALARLKAAIKHLQDQLQPVMPILKALQEQAQ